MDQRPRDVQEAISHWHMQPMLHALDYASHTLVLQLARYSEDATKLEYPVELSDPLSVPVLGDEGISTNLVSYRLWAACVHYGRQTSMGHYQAVLKRDRQLYIADDGVAPRLI